MRVSIMLIDDNEEMLDLLKLELSKHEVDAVVDWHEDLSPNILFNHDIYIVDNRIFGVPKSIDIITAIRKQQRDPHIFVMSGHTDYELLKKLFKLKINGFIDKDNLDISEIAEVAKREVETKEKLQALSAKLERTSAIMAALGIAATF